MIDFQRLDLSRKEEYERYLSQGTYRGCGYAFANLVMWGRQWAALVEGFLTIMSQYDRRTVYPFPVGQGDIRPVLEAVMEDARQRGIVCRLVGMTKEDCALVEQLFPGRFRFYPDRDGFDYVYDIQDLAELRGRKYQKKRNHLNRFRQNCPDHQVEPLTLALVPQVRAFLEDWYAQRLTEDPHRDFHLERRAMDRAFGAMETLGLEGLVLRDGDGRIIAMTMGSRLSEDTFDIHFEKADPAVEGAYAAINQAFAQYLRQRYPALKWLDREDDMGLEGLRQAKLSYYPARMIEKHWAKCMEAEDEV